MLIFNFLIFYKLLKGLEESDLEPNDAWKNLFKMMFAMGRKLSWELSSIFCPEGGYNNQSFKYIYLLVLS
jgi:hypothetical protein